MDDTNTELPDGMYLHDDVPQWKITDADGTEHVLVPAEQFMQVQKERDDHIRALACINAWRTTPHWWENPDRLHRLLNSVGMDYAAGQATQGIIEWARTHKPARTGN